MKNNFKKIFMNGTFNTFETLKKYKKHITKKVYEILRRLNSKIETSPYIFNLKIFFNSFFERGL